MWIGRLAQLFLYITPRYPGGIAALRNLVWRASILRVLGDGVGLVDGFAMSELGQSLEVVPRFSLPLPQI